MLEFNEMQKKTRTAVSQHEVSQIIKQETAEGSPG